MSRIAERILSFVHVKVSLLPACHTSALKTLMWSAIMNLVREKVLTENPFQCSDNNILSTTRHTVNSAIYIVICHVVIFRVRTNLIIAAFNLQFIVHLSAKFTLICIIRIISIQCLTPIYYYRSVDTSRLSICRFEVIHEKSVWPLQKSLAENISIESPITTSC